MNKRRNPIENIQSGYIYLKVFEKEVEVFCVVERKLGVILIATLGIASMGFDEQRKYRLFELYSRVVVKMKVQADE